MAGVYGAQVVSVEAAATEFSQFTDGASPEEVAGYLAHLGGIGTGLHELLRAEQGVGSIFRVIYTLSMLTEMVLANQHNCQRLCMLGHDVLGLLDNAGRRGAAVRDIGLEALAACFEDICSMVDAFTQPGWLLRLACDGRLREEFETLHQAVLELVKGEGLLLLAGARPPVAVDYRELCRPMRRLLKQVGSGSLTAGVQQLRVNNKSCVELARLLGVGYAVVKDEVSNLPQSDLELNTLYHQLLQPGSTTPQSASNNGTPTAAGSGRLSDASASRRASGAADADLQAAAAGLGRSSSSNSFSLSMSGQAAAALYGDLFRWYDRNKSGALEREELQAALLDLGILEGKSAVDVKELMGGYLRMADPAAYARGEGVGFEPFCRFYENLVMAKARQQLRFKLGLQVEEDLRTTFISFAGFGSREAVTEMDSAHFFKLCRECGLLDKHTGSTEADLVFCCVKNKGARRISFEQFLTALSKLAERKGVAFEDTVMKVLTAGGPTANATTLPDYVRLHDDKSTFTGVYARGGPSPLDQSSLQLSLIVDRRVPEAAKRGAGSPSSPGAGPQSTAPVHPSRRGVMRSMGGLPGSSTGNFATTPTALVSQMARSNSAGSPVPFGGFGSGSTAQQQPRSPRSPPPDVPGQVQQAQGRRASSTTPAPEGTSVSFFRRLSATAAAAGAAALGGVTGKASPGAAPSAGGVDPGALHCSHGGRRSCSPSMLDNSAGQQVGATSPSNNGAGSPFATAAAGNNSHYSVMNQAAYADNSGNINAAANSSPAATPAAGRGANMAGSMGSPTPPSLSASSKWFSFGLIGGSPATTGSSQGLIPAGGGGGSNTTGLPSPAAASGWGGGSSRRSSRDAGSDSISAAASGRTSRGGGLPRSPSGTGGELQLKDVFSAFAGFGIRSPSVTGFSKTSSGGRLSSSGRMSSSGRLSGSGSSSKAQQQQQDEYASPVHKPLMLEMDGFRFVKLCREAGLFDGQFASTGADIIFAKVKTKGAKKITYGQFMTALTLIASVKNVPAQELVDAVLRCGGPAINSSMALSSGGANAAADLIRVHEGR